MKTGCRFNCRLHARIVVFTDCRARVTAEGADRGTSPRPGDKGPPIEPTAAAVLRSPVGSALVQDAYSGTPIPLSDARRKVISCLLAEANHAAGRPKAEAFGMKLLHDFG